MPRPNPAARGSAERHSHCYAVGRFFSFKAAKGLLDKADKVVSYLLRSMSCDVGDYVQRRRWVHEDYEKLLKKVTALVVELPDESEQQKTAAAAVASAAASGKPGASLGGRKGLPAAKSTKDLAATNHGEPELSLRQKLEGLMSLSTH